LNKRIVGDLTERNRSTVRRIGDHPAMLGMLNGQKVVIGLR
jgi:hypothetical protein